MPTSYPTSADSITVGTGSDGLDSPDHAAVHDVTATAVEALEAKLGTGASTPTTAGHVLTVTGAGATAYAAPAAPTDPELAALAGLTSAADKLPYFTGSGTASTTTFTAAGRQLVDDADASAQRTTLGLVIGTNVQAYDAELAALAGLTSAADSFPYFTGSGTASLLTIASAIRTILNAADASAFRTAAGLAIGTNVQAQDAELAAIAGLTSAADKLIRFTGSGTADMVDYKENTWTPACTAGTGSITTVGTKSGWYTRVGNKVHAELSITITTNGTGASYIQTDLPIAPAHMAFGLGREIAVTGAVLTGYWTGGGSNVVLYTLAGLYPGGTGHVLTFSADYLV